MVSTAKLKPGDRVRAIRELTGLNQREFAEALGVDITLLKNIEYKRNRVTESFYEIIGRTFPEMLPWFVYEGPLTLDSLRNSKSSLCKVAAARIDAGFIPAGFFSEDIFKDGNQ
ncbi:helix-turn-helix domain-containing protein [Microbulbifer sp. 2201CG32-9]|uniref:helix-turn-helix domain-containing protein n=1 Tax=Microbulbifer sp. 2201CG32-9 TaxID=3232309 RepID=UPI00345B731E